MTIVITGTGVLVPGDGTAADLLSTAERPATPVDPATRLPGRGLRYKDRATQLGLAAAYAALTDAALLAADGLAVAGDQVAVVVSANFGNVDTVVRVVGTIADEGAAAVSPMDLPNASSNVIASSVAIRFGLRGPNLMVCNGATSGLDAVHCAGVLLRSGRARHVLVIGVEPDNPVVRRLTGSDHLLDGGAAVVLETAGTARDRGVGAQLEIGPLVRGANLHDCLNRLSAAGSAGPDAWFVPGPVPDDLLAGVPRHDLGATWGDASGALGVLQCAAAVGRLEAGGTGTVYAVNGVDTAAGLALTLPAGTAR